MTPYFLLLGAGKSGTTALTSDLRAHPGIFVSEPEEPGYFDGPDYEEHDLDWYRAAYYAGRGDEPVAGEGSSQTLFVPFAAERIARARPDARLLAILRHPVERAFSHWWMFRCFGWEPLGFGDAVARNLERLDRGEGFTGPEGIRRWYRVREAAAEGRLTDRVYVDYGHYAEQLERYLERFPPERLHVVLFDDYRERREEVVRAAWRFLGVDPEHPVPERPRRGQRYGSRTVFRATQIALRTGVQYLVPRAARRWIDRTVRRVGRPPEMPRETRDRLLEHYAPHDRRLAALLGRELPGWDR